MDPEKSSLKIQSHNLNGFNLLKEFIRRECEDSSFSILAMQEHWLRPSFRKQKGVNQLKTLHPDFDSYATSGMNDQLDQRILKGRPFGGTGFLFRKNLSNCIRALVDIKHDRVTVLELNTKNEKILLINSSLPYFNPNNISDQLSEYRDTISFIENIMTSYPNHKYILLMDINCNIFGPRNVFTDLIHEMMSEFHLVSSFDFFPNFNHKQEYTRFDVKRNSFFTLIDGIFLSKSLSNVVESSTILHPHDNVSDHLPLEININVEICEFSQEKSPISYYIPWSTLTDAELTVYQNTMSDALRRISIPFHALNHGHQLCENCDCTIALEIFYKDIIFAVEQAWHSQTFLVTRINGFKKQSLEKL